MSIKYIKGEFQFNRLLDPGSPRHLIESTMSLQNQFDRPENLIWAFCITKDVSNTMRWAMTWTLRSPYWATLVGLPSNLHNTQSASLTRTNIRMGPDSDGPWTKPHKPVGFPYPLQENIDSNPNTKRLVFLHGWVPFLSVHLSPLLISMDKRSRKLELDVDEDEDVLYIGSSISVACVTASEWEPYANHGSQFLSGLQEVALNYNGWWCFPVVINLHVSSASLMTQPPSINLQRCATSAAVGLLTMQKLVGGWWL